MAIMDNASGPNARTVDECYYLIEQTPRKFRERGGSRRVIANFPFGSDVCRQGNRQTITVL